jgi:hypothetical protein
MLPLTALNIIFIIGNTILCFYLKTVQTVVVNSVFGYDWKISLSMLAFSAQYFYFGIGNVLSRMALLLKTCMLPINVAVFVFLLYLIYLDSIAFSPEILVISGFGVAIVKNMWTFAQKERYFLEFQKEIKEYLFTLVEKEQLIRISVSPTDLKQKKVEMATERTATQITDVYKYAKYKFSSFKFILLQVFDNFCLFFLV